MTELINVSIESILTILAIVVTGFATYLTPKIQRYFAIKADKDNLGIVESVIEYGVDLAERELTGEAGEKKLDHALTYITTMLGRYKIEVSNEFLLGAIESGWKRMNEKQRGE